MHFQFGPVPRDYSLLLGLMERMGAISITEVENMYGTNSEIITSKGGYNSTSTLTADEIEILQKVFDEFGSMTAKEISDRSHKETMAVSLMRW